MKARGFSLWIFMVAVSAAGVAFAQSTPQLPAPAQSQPQYAQQPNPAPQSPTPAQAASAAPAVAPTPAVQQLQQQMQAQTPGSTLPQIAPAPASVSQTAQSPSQPSAVPSSTAAGTTAQPAASSAGTNFHPSPATDLLLSHQTADLTSKMSPDDVIDVQKQITDPYIETSITSLAKAYWAVGAFDWNNDRALDYYLMITECSLYQQYFNNEFEWVNIRHAAKMFLQKNISKLPTRFEAVIPIRLGKYDLETSQFDILPNDQKHALLRILIETNTGNMSVCGFRGPIPDYPRSVVALLDRPFSITAVPVDPRIAEFYLNDIRLNYQHKNLQIAPGDYDRVAYLRLKIRFLQFKETERNMNGSTYNAIFSKLEGWDVYADPDETKPLMIYNIPKQSVPTIFMAGQGITLSPKNPADNGKIYMPRDARKLPPAPQE